MKQFPFVLITVAGLGIMAGCSHSADKPAAAAPEKAAEPESRVKHGTNGEVIITLDAATQKLMGLETVSLVATQMSAQVKGFGRVLDPAPLADLVVELSKAELEFDKSHAELERMKVLKEQNNASEKSFQTAENTYRQNQVAVAAVLGKLKNTWGGKLAEMTGPMVVPVGTTRQWDETLERLMEAQNVLVRVDLNSGDRAEADSALLVPLSEATTPVTARFFDNARTVDPQTQGRGSLFLVESNEGKLVPGMALAAFMSATNAPADGVVVPRPAVVRSNGATWVYLQKEDDSFERTEVALDSPVADGWFVKGMKADVKVVTVGAQELLSEELKGQGGGD